MHRVPLRPFSFKVAGVSFVDDYPETLLSIVEDDEARLVAEVHPMDVTAVRVETVSGALVGYVPRGMSPVLHEALESGSHVLDAVFQAPAVGVSGRKPGISVTVSPSC